MLQKNISTRSKAGDPLEQLHQLRTDFKPGAAKRKLALLAKLSETQFSSVKSLLHYHDTLCFLRAYPDNAKLLEDVENELRSIPERVKYYQESGGDPVGVRLVNSGLSDSEVHHIFTYEMAQKLTSWYPNEIEINWERIGSASVEAIAGVLPLLVSWQENDLLDNAEAFDVRRWLTEAVSKETPTALLALLSLLRNSGLEKQVQHLLYESLELPLVWQLKQSIGSRTLNRFETGKKYYQKSPLRDRSASLLRELNRPAVPLKRLTSKQGLIAVRKVSEVLAVRYRELFPLTNANPDEVYLCEPGRGLQIYIFGTVPQSRLPLEANFGAMFIRNGLPVGYGVGVVVFDRVEIAVNVFPAFRTGESAFLIEQFFRVFYHHFGSRVYLVRRGQLGHGDDEPLKSGSFWFYYKLGFRAFDPKVREFADRENQKVQSKKGYRCSLATLKKLSKSDVVFCCDGRSPDEYRELSLVGLSNAVTSLANNRYNGNRRKMESESLRQVCRQLGIRSTRGWSDSERVALERLAPLLINLKKLDRWSRAQKQALAAIIRAKGGTHERDFVRLTNRHARLRSTLEALAAANSIH